MDRYGVAVLGGFVAVAAVAVLAVAVLTAKDSPGLAAFLAVAAAVNGLCAFYVAREARARLMTLVVIFGDALSLTLPGRRGYVVAPPVHQTLKLAAITGVEQRTEAFHALGSTVLQTAFMLKLNDGTQIFLGADRRLTEAFYEDAAAKIAWRAGVKVVDRGMVDGKPGALLLWGQRVPAWDAPALPPAVAGKRVQEEALAWRVVWIVLALCGLAVSISNFL